MKYRVCYGFPYASTNCLVDKRIFLNFLGESKITAWVNRDGQGWEPDEMKSVSLITDPLSISFDSMKGLMRNLGVSLGDDAKDGSSVFFNLLVIPAVPWYKVDNRWSEMET